MKKSLISEISKKILMKIAKRRHIKITILGFTTEQDRDILWYNDDIGSTHIVQIWSESKSNI